MAVTIYRSTDTSAPILSGQAGKLIGVLDGCLVTGYGSKSAAGQTKEYSGTNNASYQMPSGTSQCSLNVDDTGTQTARLRGFSDATAYGVASSCGVGAFPTDAQLSGGGYLYKSTSADSGARGWVLVTDVTIFHLWVDSGNNFTDSKVMSFGDIYSYNPSETNACILTPGNNSSNQTIFCDIYPFGWTYGATQQLAKNYNGTTTSAICGKMPIRGMMGYNHASQSAATFPQQPDPITGSYALSPLYIQEGSTGNGVVRGFLPGIWWYGGQGLFNQWDVIYGNTDTDLENRIFEVYWTKSGSGTYTSQFLIELTDTQRSTKQG